MPRLKFTVGSDHTDTVVTDDVRVARQEWAARVDGGDTNITYRVRDTAPWWEQPGITQGVD